MPNRLPVKKIKLEPPRDNRERIDYLFGLLDKDEKRLELIDTHRNKNLAHALVTFAAAYGAALKFFQDANPWLVCVSLFLLASAFFLRDLRLHQYSHGWNETIKIHLEKLSDAINAPNKPIEFQTYYGEGERLAIRLKEWVSPTRLAYYVLLGGAILSYFIFSLEWFTKHTTNV